MFKIKPYSLDSTIFLENVINSKRKRKDDNEFSYKDRISTFNNDLKIPYNTYDKSFKDNTLYSISNNKKFTNAQVKSDLMTLYKYSSAPFIRLKNELVKLPNNRSFDTCQYCCINSINTFDHILPKDVYPEFVVHPKNLFPACSECNGKKSTKFIKEDIPEFLNLYIHNLPIKKYLFVELKLIQNTFEVNFYLKNINNIDPFLFKIINNHFKNLDLLNRYNRQASSIISNFETTIVSNLSNFSLDELLKISKTSLQAHKENLGYNHYKIILEEELCCGTAFKDYCENLGYIHNLK